ncbi:MAG TPA: sulfite exporter TauE/SafE family protein, partial [Vicinamibacterales bacterium]|nr:sulfite exporter TauE/SafE family protein [Vicinamibacterales bacterium]
HWPTVRTLACGSIPGALFGLGVLSRIPQAHLDTLLQQALGAALVLVGLVSVTQIVRRPTPASSMPSSQTTAAIGAVIGFLVAITSIGGGSLLLAAFVLWFPFRPSTMVGTDLAHALVLSAVAATGHFFAGRVDLALSATVLAGAVPGVIAGASVATWMPQRALRGCLAAVLLAIGLRLAGG